MSPALPTLGRSCWYIMQQFYKVVLIRLCTSWLFAKASSRVESSSSYPLLVWCVALETVFSTCCPLTDMPTRIVLIISWRWKTKLTSSWAYSQTVLLLEFLSPEASLCWLSCNALEICLTLKHWKVQGSRVERVSGDVFLPLSLLLSFPLFSSLFLTVPCSIPAFHFTPLHSTPLPSIPICFV